MKNDNFSSLKIIGLLSFQELWSLNMKKMEADKAKFLMGTDLLVMNSQCSLHLTPSISLQLCIAGDDGS